jgi:hypothetical protein
VSQAPNSSGTDGSFIPLLRSVRARSTLRYDLETIWRLRKAELEDDTIAFKLVLPAGSEAATNKYLVDKGFSRAFIFPDEHVVA